MSISIKYSKKKFNENSYQSMLLEEHQSEIQFQVQQLHKRFGTLVLETICLPNESTLNKQNLYEDLRHVKSIRC